MAACTFSVATADTGNTPNTSEPFTPATGDLLVVAAHVSNELDAGDDAQLSSSISGFTFKYVNASIRGAQDTVFVYVSEALVSDTSSQTVTWTHTSDTGNGSVISVYRVSGMSKTGLTAIRQSAINNAGSGVTPGQDFAASCLTGNPTLTFLINSSNPAGLTPPTGWTEDASANVGYNNPTTGASSAFRDSGFTGTRIDWGASATGWALVQIELDASAASSLSIPICMYHYQRMQRA